MEIINMHLFVADTDMKSQKHINVSKKYSLTVTGRYQIVRSTINLVFHTRIKFPLHMPQIIFL